MILPVIRTEQGDCSRSEQSDYNRQTIRLIARRTAYSTMSRPPPLHTIRHSTIVMATSLLIFSSFAAKAANWTALESRNETRIEVDRASLERGTEKIRVWHRETYGRPQILETGAFSFASMTALNEFQCAKRLFAPIQRNYFSADGRELKSERSDGKDSAPVAPDSLIESVFTYVCKEKAKAASPTATKATGTGSPPTENKTPAKKPKSGKDDAAHHEEIHWSYEGKHGAARWAALNADFATCGSGQRQSPIDVRETIRADLSPINFRYKPVALSLVDSGHTIQVNTAGAGSISVDGEEYELLQFHFHKPSEEKINGKAYDMVAHLVHKSKAGKLAVVAVLLQAGKEHKLIRTLWNNLPLEQNKPVARADMMIDPTQLLPATRNYFTYNGSLTTPPCSEGVLWLLLKTPTQLSTEQVADFGKIYRNNARPTQARNGRIIKGSR